MKKLLLLLALTSTLLLGCVKNDAIENELLEIQDDASIEEVMSSDPILDDNLDEAMKTLEELEGLGIE